MPPSGGCRCLTRSRTRGSRSPPNPAWWRCWRTTDWETVPFIELLDEPFLALPSAAGPLRDYWLATEVHCARPARIGAEISNSDETYEALVDGVACAFSPPVTLHC